MSVERERRRATDWRWRRQFASDVFHTISQPLTAVQIALELALKKKRPEDVRSTIREALETTASAIDKARFVRLLAEAEDPGDIAKVDLDRLLEQVVSEMGPVALAQGSKMVRSGAGPVWVQADEGRLGQALFLLTDSVLRRCPSAELHIRLQWTKRIALLSFSTGGCPMKSRTRRLQLVPFEEEERAVSLVRVMVGALRGRVEHWREGPRESWVLRIPRLD